MVAVKSDIVYTHKGAFLKPLQQFWPERVYTGFVVVK